MSLIYLYNSFTSGNSRAVYVYEYIPTSTFDLSPKNPNNKKKKSKISRMWGNKNALLG